MGLRRRIFVNHLATLAIATTGTLLGLWAGNQLWRNSHVRVQVIERELQVIDDLNIRILQALPARNHYQASTKISLIQELEMDRQVMKQFIIHLEGIQALEGKAALAPELKHVLAVLIQNSQALIQGLDESKARLLASSKDPDAQRQIINDLIQANAITRLQNAINQLEQLRSRLSGELESAQEAEERSEALELLIPILSSLMAAGLGLLLAWRTSGLILRPIDRLNRRIAELRASGKLDLQPLEQKNVPAEIRSLNDNFNRLIQRLGDVHAQLEQLSLTDPLTQVGNRRCFDRMLHAEVARHRREGASMALLMLDLDRFKPYNDCYGHPAGDQCLIAVADVLKHLFRRSGDCICRIGGEEFAVVLPRTAIHEAEELALRIVKTTAALNLEHRANPPIGRVSVSVGVSCGRPSESLTGSWLLQAADQALYRCKGELGRNTVACAPAQEFGPSSIAASLSLAPSPERPLQDRAASSG